MGESTITTTKNRIDTIDVLRGFALAGILYAHMIIWYTGAAIPQEIYFKYDNTIDYLAFAIFGAFVYGKFFSVFSFLFGLGFYLYFRRKKSNSGTVVTYIWRLFLLFLIGILHHTIWRGDILAIYAVLGGFLLIFRHFPLKIMLLISLLLIVNLPIHIYDLVVTNYLNTGLELPMEAKAQDYYKLVKEESFVMNLKENWSSWPAKIQFQLQSGRLLITFGYFLLGFYAGRTNLFTSIEKNLSRFQKWNKYTGRLVLFLLLIGLVMLLMEVVTLPRIEVDPRFKWVAGFLFSIYNAGLTLFYITGVTLLFRNEVFHSLLKPLAAMGRLALTNYLLQTVFGLLLFYNFGFGLFDITSPAINIVLGMGVFFLQLKFSQYWLNHFKQGPLEWLWRSLTYFQFLSNRKTPIRASKGTEVV